MSKPISSQSMHDRTPVNIRWTRYSELSSSGDRQKVIGACRNLTGELYPGLDLKKEISSVERQKLGDTILMYDKNYSHQDNGTCDQASSLIGLAICHCGPKTEAGSGTCYIKFGAIRPGDNASNNFDCLLDVGESFTRSQGLSRIVGGANTARHNTYKKMIERNYHTDLQGVTMHRPNEVGYSRERRISD